MRGGEQADKYSRDLLGFSGSALQCIGELSVKVIPQIPSSCSVLNLAQLPATRTLVKGLLDRFFSDAALCRHSHVRNRTLA